jgi:hypothetical protein
MFKKDCTNSILLIPSPSAVQIVLPVKKKRQLQQKKHIMSKKRLYGILKNMDVTNRGIQSKSITRYVQALKLTSSCDSI